jgi:hypothetical protein
MDGKCGCGAVEHTKPTAEPTMIFQCHCIDYHKQLCSAFETLAILSYFSVADDPPVSFFIRKCDSGREQHCYFCTKCGSRILHAHMMSAGETIAKTVAEKVDYLKGLSGVVRCIRFVVALLYRSLPV